MITGTAGKRPATGTGSATNSNPGSSGMPPDPPGTAAAQPEPGPKHTPPQRDTTGNTADWIMEHQDTPELSDVAG